jgi:hypothetical protein
LVEEFLQPGLDQILCVCGVYTAARHDFQKQAINELLCQKEWMPRIGKYTYTPVTQFKHQPPTDPSWEGACASLTRICRITLTESQLRNQLNRLLRRLEQMGTSNYLKYNHQADPDSVGFTVDINFILVCESIGVAIPYSPRRDREDNHQVISDDINRCEPFFKQPITASKVEAWVGCLWEAMGSDA